MLSLVENIYSVLRPLKVRAVDRHHEEKHLNLNDVDKDSHKRRDDLNINDEEFNTISVKALLLFLEDFLESRLNSRLTSYNESTISPWLKHKQSNDDMLLQTKNATNAYAHAAEIKRTPRNKAKQNDKYELKKIYTLIRDLRHLQDCGVKYLNIESKEALIKGIFSATDNAKNDVC